MPLNPINLNRVHVMGDEMEAEEEERVQCGLGCGCRWRKPWRNGRHGGIKRRKRKAEPRGFELKAKQRGRKSKFEGKEGIIRTSGPHSRLSRASGGFGDVHVSCIR